MRLSPLVRLKPYQALQGRSESDIDWLRVNFNDYLADFRILQQNLGSLNGSDRIRACYQHCCLKWVMNERMTNQSLRARFDLPESKMETASRIIRDTLEAGRIKASVYIDQQLLNKIKGEADERRVSQQALIENALKDRYSEVTQMERDAAIAERLNRVDMRMRKMGEQIEMVSEGFALYVRMWLASTPEVPADERDIAIKNAQERYHRYVEQLSKILSH